MRQDGNEEVSQDDLEPEAVEVGHEEFVIEKMCEIHGHHRYGVYECSGEVPK